MTAGFKHDPKPPAPGKRTHPWRAYQGTKADRRIDEQRRERVVPYHARMGVKG